MSSFSQERKQERLMYYNPATLVTERTYNTVLGLTIAYGLIVNVILCLFAQDLVLSIPPMALMIGYVVCCIAGILISQKSDSAVISFIGYNLVVVPLGLVVTLVVWAYGGAGSPVVLQAFLYTAIITACMIGLSISFPTFFSKIGGILLASIVGMVICELIAAFLGINQNIFAWIGAIIFSLYIGYDFWKAQEYPKTMDNAVDSALDIYIDIIGLFLRILRILGNGRSSRSSS